MVRFFLTGMVEKLIITSLYYRKEHKDKMKYMNVEDLEKNICKMLNVIGKCNGIASVLDKEAHVVCLSREEHRELSETLYLLSDEKVADEIREALAEPISEAVYLEGNRI